MESKLVRVGVIGCGRVAGHHCRSIGSVEGAQLIAVCDLVAAKAAAYGRDFKVPHYEDYRLMLKQHPEISMVAVITPSGMHFEHAAEIMSQYKKDIIVEKPTFMKLSQAGEAFDLARKLGLNLFPVFQNRYNLAVCRVREAIRNGELGGVRIVAVRVRWCRPQRYYELAEWRGTFAMDGGALTNQGIHHIDLLRNLGGEVARVCSTMRTLGADIEVEDTGTAIMEYESGAIGTLEVTTAARPSDFEASISLVCEKGLAQIGGIAVNELQVFTPDPAACKANTEDFSGNVYGHGHGDMYRDIVAFYREGRAYPVSREDCTSTLRLLHAFYYSNETGSWVAVKEGHESRHLGRSDEDFANLYRTRK